MPTVDAHEAKTELLGLPQVVASGGKVLIARADEAVIRLEGVPQATKARRLGLLQGKFNAPDDFDAALPGDVAALFEGR